MNQKILSSCLALVLGAGVGYALDAYAQAKPEVLVKQRQAVMILHGKYWGPLGGMAKGKVPYNAEIVARNARFLDALSQMPWDGFHPSTKDAQNTKALPAVYDDPAKFKEAQDRYRAAIGKLVAAGDEGAFKAAAGEVGKSCGGCHNDFRAKK
ncbi:MAG: cytochrome c [Betaproteobacteria bacterium]|nr:cytochrome c [Betaproteobacteria bacterium]